MSNGVALISDQDAKRVEGVTWYKNGRGYVEAYYRHKKGSYGRLLLHRFLMNPAEHLVVDHINGDPLDNRRENLRVCTPAENSRNKRKGRGASKYKGVSWHTDGQMWTAQISLGKGNKKHLGAFADELDAAKAYDRASKEYYGAFARPNFSTPSETYSATAHRAFLKRAFAQLLPHLPSGVALQDLFFAGGCVFNYANNEPVNDFDVFIATEATRDAVRAHFQANPQGVLVQTENAVTLKVPHAEAPFQIVTRFVGGVDRIFKDFDFEMTKSFYVPHTDTLSCDLDIVHNKKLIYTGQKDTYTLNTLKRLCKFVARGWEPDNQTIINLHRAIQRRPSIDDPAEHAAQTIGFYGSSFT